MGELIYIDDFKHEKAPNAKKHNIAEQYRTIGETLEICEVTSLRAGVPWLPPNKSRKEIIKKYQPPLEDFIKTSLVSVSTETLDHYCEDLNSFTFNNSESLCIPILYPIERFFFCFVVFVFLFTLSLALGIFLGTAKGATLVMSFMTATPATLLAAFPCLEVQRRSNFYFLLNKELSRRRGSNSPSSGKIILSSS